MTALTRFLIRSSVFFALSSSSPTGLALQFVMKSFVLCASRIFSGDKKFLA